MFTDDIVEVKAKEIEQETSKAYFTRLIDVHVSSNIEMFYRSLQNVKKVQVKEYGFEKVR